MTQQLDRILVDEYRVILNDHVYCEQTSILGQGRHRVGNVVADENHGGSLSPYFAHIRAC